MAIAVVASLVVFGGNAFAQSPHFVQAVSASVDSSGDLTVSFKEAGLGGGQTITYVTGAQGTAVYACINGGGKHPSAANKQTINGPVAGTGTFTAGKNGTISGSLTADPPPSPNFCPTGQTFILAFVSYSGISIRDNVNGITADASPSALSACLVSGPLATELCQ